MAPNLVQIGEQKWRIIGRAENSNMDYAQRFCRARGFVYAEEEYNHDTSGNLLFGGESSATNFFCMNSGDYTYPTYNPGFNVNIYNNH
jgi:hypothetical protein